MTPAQQQLALEHLKLARTLASLEYRRQRGRFDFDDLHTWAVDGLLDAARRFKPEMGYRFKTYARHRILGQLTDGIRARVGQRSRAGRKATLKVVGELAGLWINRSAVAVDPLPDEVVSNRYRAQLLLGACQTLERRELELVTRHYFGGERFDRVAASLGLSKSWASRLHNRAIESLRKRLANRATELLEV